MSRTDVVILGGGLAGLRWRCSYARVCPSSLSRCSNAIPMPVPEAAHKVGESTVEIGAHYLDTVLGLADHLREAQLRKFGFRFFFSDGERRRRRGDRARCQPVT